MDRIDAHIHLAGDDDATRAMLEEIGIFALNICVATGDWRETVHPRFRSLAASHPDRYAWCTSFDLPDPDGEGRSYAERVIAALKDDLRDGAVAVKAWKNIGMELRRADGSWVMIDDPLFDPIYEFLARESVPMVMHIGEPLACWQPLDERSPHYTYYRDHPQWHLHGRADVPSHAELVAARDRVLAKHPELRVVGAHLGSLEYDVAEVAARLDRYPNFAVDISARLGDLMRQRASDVADFLTRYADRVIFGTDLVFRQPLSSLDEAARDQTHATIRSTYDAYFRYLESHGRVEFARQSSPGLGLADDVVTRITSTTARTWFPALA